MANKKYFTEESLNTLVETIKSLLNGKANKSTTLSGYGIADTYTKTQIDTIANNKSSVQFITWEADD